MKLKIALILYIILTLGYLVIIEMKHSQHLVNMENILNSVYFEAE